MNRKRHLALLIMLLATTLAGAETRPVALTVTVKVAGMELRVADLMMKSKEGYVYLMWDVFPSRVALKKASIADVVEGLLQGPLHKKFPKASRAVVDVVEFSERDEYGMPRWDTLRKLAHYEGKAGPRKKWVLKEEK